MALQFPLQPGDIGALALDAADPLAIMLEVVMDPVLDIPLAVVADHVSLWAQHELPKPLDSCEELRRLPAGHDALLQSTSATPMGSFSCTVAAVSSFGTQRMKPLLHWRTLQTRRRTWRNAPLPCQDRVFLLANTAYPRKEREKKNNDTRKTTEIQIWWQQKKHIMQNT